MNKANASTMSIREEMRSLRYLFGFIKDKVAHKLIYFFLPFVLSFIVVAIDGIIIGLLIPLVKGVADKSYAFIYKVPIYKKSIALLPRILFGPDESAFAWIVIIIFTLSIIKNVLSYFSSLMSDIFEREASIYLKDIVFARVLTFGKLFFDRTSVGVISGAVSSYISALSGKVGTIKNFIGSAFSQIMYFAILIKISWKVTAAILIIYPILNYSSIWIIKKIKATSRVQAIHQIKFSQYIHNVLSCITLVKTMSTEDGEKRRFSELNNISERFSVSIIKKKLLLGPIHEMISVTMVISIVVAVVYIVKKDPTANITGFLVYFYVLRRFLSGSNFINSFNTTIAAASGSMVNLMNILNNENKFFITGGKREFAGLKTEIRLYHLNFSYIDAVPVLKDINFTIEKGKMTALVGPTGAGKTTITNLVLRLYEVQDNSIFIDGVDIKEFSIKTLMKRMAVVSQDAMLFNSSIRDNILYGLSDSIPDEIFEEALKKAHLFDLVSQLPEGVNTFIGDKGIKLSGGERQRLAIARALLRKPDILILDEATSSLDSITEKLVQEAVEEAVSDNTSLVIAHRLSTIKHADKIIVVEGGRIVEQGSLNELIEKKGRFYSYWQAQKFE